MAKVASKVYAVVGFIPYENQDVLGIYTSKRAAVKAATDVAKRPTDHYADYVNYSTVAVYAITPNVKPRDLGFYNDTAVWESECGSDEDFAEA